MEQALRSSLKSWVRNNQLFIGEENILPRSNFFEINTDSGQEFKFYIVEPKNEKIITDDFILNLTDEEKALEIDFYVYFFGGVWYYIEKENIDYHQLKPFKYFGRSDQELDYDMLFHHLGVHGRYELLNGTRDYSNWCEKALFLNHQGLGLCERHTLAGVIPFQEACKKHNLKFAIGEEFDMIYEGSKDQTHSVKCYVKNKKGWVNLLALNCIINVEKKAFITLENLKAHQEGLSIVFGPTTDLNKVKYNNFIADIYFQLDSVEYRNKKTDLALLNNIKDYFENHHNLIAPILINDSYVLDKEEVHMKDILNKIGGLSKLQPDSYNQYYKSIQESFDIFEPHFKNKESFFFDIFTESIENTNQLMKHCEFEIETGTFKLPEFDIQSLPKKYHYLTSNKDLFMDLLFEGITKLKLNDEELDLYTERLKIEINLIEKGGFIDYFLILWDIIRWCKEQQILTGLGRGSAAGSLIAYLLKITKVDPIKNNLLFERFLNEGRIKSLPDIDTDFETNRREEVLDFMREKYGVNYVTELGSYNTLKIKSAIKDLARTAGLDFKKINILTTSVMKFKENKDYQPEEIFKLALKEPQIYNFVQEHSEIINDMILTLQQPKSSSKHPCATIIIPQGDGDLYENIPLRKDQNDHLISEWEGGQLEQAGYLKEDILSLLQLDKIRLIIDLIKKDTGEDINIYKIPIDDPKVMGYFKEGWTSDIFQFSSPGLTAYCKDVKPENLEDLVAMVALFRPGPIGSNAHTDFVDLKSGAKNPEYDFQLQSVTENTHGLYIYQEQVMKACEIMGGFSLAETDDVRRAMGKKKMSVLVPYKKKFIDHAVKIGAEKEHAESVWKKLEVFSEYGFNRSHAMCYAQTGYISQWLKVYYPIHFWTAAFEFVEKDYHVYRYISEIRKTSPDIEIIPPDLNVSSSEFEVDTKAKKIYWSLSRIKFLGEVGLESILENRKEEGNFYSIEDFVNRVPKGDVNKRVVTNLILSGAFDNVVGEGIQKPQDRINTLKKYYDLRTDVKPDPSIIENQFRTQEWWWTLKQKELSGLGEFDYKGLIKKARLKPKPFLDSKYLQDEENLDKVVSFGGLIQDCYERNSKYGKWASITLESNNEQTYLYIWNPEWQDLDYKDIFLTDDIKDKLCIFTGIVKYDRYKKMNVLHLYSKDQFKLL